MWEFAVVEPCRKLPAKFGKRLLESCNCGEATTRLGLVVLVMKRFRWSSAQL